MSGCELDVTGSGEGPAAGYCGQSDGHSVPNEDRDFLSGWITISFLIVAVLHEGM
jgi:hypothetical protein